MKFITRLPIEFQVVFVRDTVRRAKDVTTLRAFTTWAIEHNDVLV